MAVSNEQLRAEVQKLLQDIDVKTFTIGKLRASVESNLGLTPGALEGKKADLAELVRQLLTEAQEAAEVAAPPAKKPKLAGTSGKEKKDKKDKKEKKEKSDKKQSKDKKDKTNKKEKKEASAEEEEAEEQVDQASEQTEPPPASAAAGPVAPVALFEDEEGLEAEALPDPALPADSAVKPTVKPSGLLSGAEDGGIRFWDKGRCIKVLDGHKGAVHDLVVNWETLQAVSGAEDSTKLWSLKFGGCIRTMSDTPEGALSVSADWDQDQALVGCGDGTVRIWSLKTADLQHKFTAHRGGVWALEGNFKEGYLGSAGDEAAKIWNTKDWTCIYSTPGHAGGLMCISVNWTGSQILGGCGSTTSLQLWDLQDIFAQDNEKTKPNSGTKRPDAAIYHGHQDVVPDLAVDWGKSVAVTGGWDANLIVWNLKHGNATHTHQCKFGRVRSLSVDFANSQVWCGSSNGNLHCMDLRSGLIQKTLEGHGGAVTAVSANVG